MRGIVVSSGPQTGAVDKGFKKVCRSVEYEFVDTWTMLSGGCKSLFRAHSALVESNFEGGITLSVYLKRGVAYSLPDCQYGVVEIVNRINTCNHQEGEVVSGIIRGRGFKIVVPIKINHIFSVVRSGTRGGITLAQ